MISQGLHTSETDSVTLAPVPKTDSNTGLKDMLVDGAIGTAVGAGIDGLAQVANVSLFASSLLLAPLVMLGWTGVPAPVACLAPPPAL